jgi:hypothetical protein
LRHFTVVLPDEKELDRVAGQFADAAPAADGAGIAVKDPSKNTLILALSPK